MNNTMCTKEYDSEMRDDCKCKKCLLVRRIKTLEQSIDKEHGIYNKASRQYHDYLNKIYNKSDYSWRVKINSNYDEKSKRLWNIMEVSEKKSKPLVYRLIGLERRLEDIEENEHFDWDNPKYKRLLEILTK